MIDEYHILTAAHCVASYTEDDVRRLRVQLGVHNIKNTPGKSTHKVDRIIRHIDFSQRTLVSMTKKLESNVRLLNFHSLFELVYLHC